MRTSTVHRNALVSCVALLLTCGCSPSEKPGGDGGQADGTATDASHPDGAQPDGAQPDGAQPDATVTDGSTGVCTPGTTQSCGSTDVGACEFGEETCDTTGHWGPCVGGVGPTAEVCNSLDDNCDGAVDEGLDTDFGPFAGCANYRYLIDSALQWLTDGAAAGASGFKPQAEADLPNIATAAFGLIARAEFHLQSAGLPLPAGARKDLIDQALEQTDAMWLWEASQPAATALRSAAGHTHACRGWFGSVNSYTSVVSGLNHPAYTMSMYYTGPILYGYALLAKAIYTDPPSPAATYLAEADQLNDRVGAILNHWFTTQTPDDHFWASYPASGTENWLCQYEHEDECYWNGQRFVKWNIQTFAWRGAAVWNDNYIDFQGGTSMQRRTRAMRFARWMKQDMLDTSAPWNNNTPYVWHSWADWGSAAVWDYIEDASHGAFDVGLMVEAWRGGWMYNSSLADSDDESYNGDTALMGPGSASRFRRTYMDNLAKPNDPCVWAPVDGSKTHDLLAGRRRHLSEWVPMAAGDEAYLMELQEDLTGVCDGNAPLSPAIPRPEYGLSFVRLWTEARAIRGE